MTTAHVPEPTLELRDGTPVSGTFGDVYFSREGGVAETEHVFLAANGLPHRWQASDKQTFSIGELGFGTGLNFLVTLKHFRTHAPAALTLHYHAVEKFPFRPEMLAPLLAQVPELGMEAAELLARYPLRLPGPHRVVFDRAVLTLWFGEVADWLAALPSASIDAWYLDGFAPAKNPDMWGEAVFAAMAQASGAGASFATFTAASAVRRGLVAAGFEVEKVPGFGRKREMLRGHKPFSALVPTASGETRSGVIVIGAGIAGASLAYALATRDYRVTVLERETAAGGASGNAAGVLFPPLPKRWTAQAAFYFAGFDLMLRQIARWRGEARAFATASPGMLRLPRHAEEEAQLSQLGASLGLDPSIVQWLDRQAASDKTGVVLPTGAAYFPQGTWLCPQALCDALLRHPHITLREYAPVTAVARVGGAWEVTLAEGEVLRASVVCVAAANETARLLPGHALALQPVGGQVSAFAAAEVAAPLNMILCRKGYVIPCGEHYLTGATYHREGWLDVTEARHAENFAELAATLPGWFSGKPTHGRSAVRATTPSRAPYIGALAEGLYVSTGHGSRGLLSAPLAAEMIASEMAGEASPVAPDIRAWLAQALKR